MSHATFWANKGRIEHSNRLVINAIEDHGPINVPGIAAATGLAEATVRAVLRRINKYALFRMERPSDKRWNKGWQYSMKGK